MLCYLFNLFFVSIEFLFVNNWTAFKKTQVIVKTKSKLSTVWMMYKMNLSASNRSRQAPIRCVQTQFRCRHAPYRFWQVTCRFRHAQFWCRQGQEWFLWFHRHSWGLELAHHLAPHQSLWKFLFGEPRSSPVFGRVKSLFGHWWWLVVSIGTFGAVVIQWFFFCSFFSFVVKSL